MSIYTVISKNYPKEVQVDPDFPKCECGGEFKVQDNFNKRGSFHGTTATCSSCGEYFVGDSYAELNDSLPQYQQTRKRN